MSAQVHPIMHAVISAPRNGAALQLSPELQQQLLISVVQELHEVKRTIDRLSKILIVICTLLGGPVALEKILTIAGQ